MTVALELAEWATDLSDADIPTDIRQIARRHLTDAIGNAIAARRLGTVDFALGTATRFAPEPPVSIIGGGTAGPEGAAFANGALIHGLDFDDTHADALVHVSAVTAPTMLALGEASDVDLTTAMTSMIAGMEIAARLGMAVHHGFHNRGFHATGVVGTFTSALIAAKMRGLGPKTTATALGIAGSLASGSLEFLNAGSSTKQLHPGWASMAGIMAAQLAADGASGPHTIIEGDYGLYALFSDRAADTSSIPTDLGRTWETGRITIKPYPVCQLSHATIDAVASIDAPLAPANIEAIDVDLPADAMPVVAEPTERKIKPSIPYDAKFSVQWCVAAMIIDGGLSVDTFTDVSIRRPEVAALAHRVRVHPVAVDTVPASAPGRVTVTYADGTTTSGSVSTSAGTPDDPLSDDELAAKFTANCGSAVDPEPILDELYSWRATVRGLLATTAVAT